ncbi:MAG TPA: bacillithiol transferase BstA [Acidisarcina sp.]
MSTQTVVQDSRELLRFPVGRAPRPPKISPLELQKAIAAIAALPENLRSAVVGLTDEQLDTPYRDGGWSVRTLVHHVADSHLNMFIRFKLALTEDWPTIRPYEQDAWAVLADSKLPVEVSLALIESLHRRWVALMEAMTDIDWKRGFVHPETGRFTLPQAVMLYDWHGRHHTAHVTELRNRMGWKGFEV